MTDDEQEALFLAAGPGDEYKFSKISFEPDVIYDIGADVGSITLFVADLFPNTKIVAVEPNPWSFPRLTKNAAGIHNIVAVNAAVGQGPMFEPDQCEPLHWMVVSRDAPAWNNSLVPATVPAIGLDELHTQHGGERYAVKVDVEGGEVEMMRHEPSRQVLLNSAYFAAELHFWGQTRAQMMAAYDTVSRFFFELAQTHTLYTYSYGACGHVWAKRRGPENNVEAWLE